MSMRKILTHEPGLSLREVREATGVGKTAVSEYVRRAKAVGLTWPIPPEISDAALIPIVFLVSARSGRLFRLNVPFEIVQNSLPPAALLFDRMC
jgi:hypothetical protein